MEYLNRMITPQRNAENPRVSAASERLGHGHLSAIEYMAYNITDNHLKGK